MEWISVKDEKPKNGKLMAYHNSDGGMGFTTKIVSGSQLKVEKDEHLDVLCARTNYGYSPFITHFAVITPPTPQGE